MKTPFAFRRSAIVDPSTVSGMAWRVRASSAVTSSGNTLIDSIPNDGTLGHGSLNVNDMAFVSARPKYSAASANFNGKPAVLFDGAQELSTGTLSTAISQPSTFYAYVRIVDTNVASSVAVRLNGNSSANAATLAITPSTDTILYTEFGGSPLTSTALYGKHLVCVVYNGASTQIFIDDMTTPVATGTSGAGACTKIQSKLFSASLAPMEWPEQIGYSGSHDAATRESIKSYFTGTYG